MSDADDSDEEDLWADFDNEEETTIAVSENLRDTVSHDLAPVHQGDVDEGKVTWESPIAPGLQNSLKVTEGHDKHWYHEETKAAPSQTPGGAAPANPIAGPSSATRLRRGSARCVAIGLGLLSSAGVGFTCLPAPAASEAAPLIGKLFDQGRFAERARCKSQPRPSNNPPTKF